MPIPLILGTSQQDCLNLAEALKLDDWDWVTLRHINRLAGTECSTIYTTTKLCHRPAELDKLTRAANWCWSDNDDFD